MDYFTIAGVALIGVALAFFGLRRRSDAKEAQRIQDFFKSNSIDEVREGIRDELKSETGAINDDLDSKNPARNLAARGNARTRRKKS
jgi:Flp pilus assembly protein TadB